MPVRRKGEHQMSCHNTINSEVLSDIKWVLKKPSKIGKLIITGFERQEEQSSDGGRIHSSKNHPLWCPSDAALLHHANCYHFSIINRKSASELWALLRTVLSAFFWLLLQKKSHSTLRAKRATFTFWVDKS